MFNKVKSVQVLKFIFSFIINESKLKLLIYSKKCKIN